MVKKSMSGNDIAHDLRLNAVFGKECCEAISHTKSANSMISQSSFIINPHSVLSLFKKIPEEVCAIELLFYRIINHVHSLR